MIGENCIKNQKLKLEKLNNFENVQSKISTINKSYTTHTLRIRKNCGNNTKYILGKNNYLGRVMWGRSWYKHWSPHCCQRVLSDRWFVYTVLASQAIRHSFLLVMSKDARIFLGRWPEVSYFVIQVIKLLIWLAKKGFTLLNGSNNCWYDSGAENIFWTMVTSLSDGKRLWEDSA